MTAKPGDAEIGERIVLIVEMERRGMPKEVLLRGDAERAENASAPLSAAQLLIML
jgi:hypothetical protein